MSTTKQGEQLSTREELFVGAYLANGGNATQAAIEAGYSKNGADSRGAQLRARPHVAKAIAQSKSRILKKYHVTAERIVQEMSIIAFSDIRHYTIDDNGYLELAAGAPDDAMRAIKRFKRKRRTILQKDGDPIIEIECEFEFWSKDTELRNLGEYKKLFKENRAENDAEDDDLTPEQRRERVLQLLKRALTRMKAERATAPARKKR